MTPLVEGAQRWSHAISRDSRRRLRQGSDSRARGPREPRTLSACSSSSSPVARTGDTPDAEAVIALAPSAAMLRTHTEEDRDAPSSPSTSRAAPGSRAVAGRTGVGSDAAGGGAGTVVAAPGIQPAPHLGVVAAASATGVTHTTRTLSLQALGDIAIDPTHQHVFITGNPNLTNDSILVTDYSGAEVTTISGESGAAGMVVDGSTLYVARCGATSGIDVFDTGTLTKTGSITATVADGRCDLALSGRQALVRVGRVRHVGIGHHRNAARHRRARDGLHELDLRRR